MKYECKRDKLLSLRPRILRWMYGKGTLKGEFVKTKTKNQKKNVLST